MSTKIFCAISRQGYYISANPENVKKQGGFAEVETVAGQGI
jgi:hypothetical protein